MTHRNSHQGKYRDDHSRSPNHKSKSKNPREEVTKSSDNSSSDLSNYLEDQQMIDQLKKNGILSLFPVQQATFNQIVKGNDLTTRDRTGSGKTLAYSLPVLERLRKNNLLTGNQPKLLIMVPTRELAIQVRDCLSKISMS